MYADMDWQIKIGSYQLALLAGVEIHRSVDLLADTCSITLPGYETGKAFRVEQQIGRGDAVSVQLGYNGNLVTEFSGYLLQINTDDNRLVLECEDELFLMRKSVANKQFKNATVKQIAQYLVQQTGTTLQVDCTLGIDYDKFVIHAATAYDVLKLLQDETKANIYLRNGVLHIHPPYLEKHGRVRYSFQQNIEESSLKYKRTEDKKLQVIVENIGTDGKKKEISSGTTGGDKITIKGNGLSDVAMKSLADAEYRRNLFDGYEGDVTTWLVPYVEPGYSAEIKDEDYEYKDGWYYVTAVTTAFDENGGSRKVQLGIKVAGNG